MEPTKVFFGGGVSLAKIANRWVGCGEKLEKPDTSSPSLSSMSHVPSAALLVKSPFPLAEDLILKMVGFEELAERWRMKAARSKMRTTLRREKKAMTKKYFRLRICKAKTYYLDHLRELR